MPPSSLYCTQKSVSRISAAAAKRSSAASPRASLPLCSSGECSVLWASELGASRPALMVAAPAAAKPPFMNERRLIPLLRLFRTCFMGITSLVELRDGRFNGFADLRGATSSTQHANSFPTALGRRAETDFGQSLTVHQHHLPSLVLLLPREWFIQSAPVPSATSLGSCVLPILRCHGFRRPPPK